MIRSSSASNAVVGSPGLFCGVEAAFCYPVDAKKYGEDRMGSMAQIAERCCRTAVIVNLFAMLNALMLATASPVAQAATCTADPDARLWTVVGDAATDTDISGAACAPDGQCLLVSDEKNGGPGSSGLMRPRRPCRN
jgi:hypothetical protein